MIKVNLKMVDNNIRSFQISGHANQAKYGEDLVCAAVSGIVGGALNALSVHQPKDIELNVEENLIFIRVIKLRNKELNIMMNMLKIQLYTIQIQYPKAIKIKEN